MKHKLVFLIVTTSLIMSCQKKASPDTASDIEPMKAEILLADVSSNNCLNLEKLMSYFKNPRFSFPSATMNTDFKTITTLSSNKEQYLSYATFYYKVSKANELALFNDVKQIDCSTIEILSASRETLTYKIIESSENHIKFQLTDKMREDMTKAQKVAMMDRIQPFEYTVTYASKNNLTIAQKYSSVDPICESKKPLKLELTKSITWAETDAELPSRYEVNPEFYSQVKHAVMMDPTLQLPSPDVSGTLAVADIKSVMMLPVRNEVKYCN